MKKQDVQDKIQDINFGESQQKTEVELKTEEFIKKLNELQQEYKRTLYAVNTLNDKGEIGPIIKILIQ
jgi:archaellum component FlaC